MINKCTLVGHLGRDGELKVFGSGMKVGEFSIATTRSYKNRDEEWINETEWHRCKCFGFIADRCSKLKKGNLIYVEGRIKYGSYEKGDGTKVYTTDIIVGSFRLLEKKESQVYDAKQDDPVPSPDLPKDNNPGSNDDLPF